MDDQSVRKPGYTHLLKVIIVGTSGAGKSTLLLQFTDKKFLEKYEETIGVEFGSRIIDVNGKKVKLQIWDTAGKEDFRSITRSYYRGSQLCVYVWDASKQLNMEELKSFVAEVRRQAASENIPFLFMGTKLDADKREESWAEQEAEVRAFANTKGQEIKDFKILNLSLKTSAEVEKSFIPALVGLASQALNGVEEAGLISSDPAVRARSESIEEKPSKFEKIRHSRTVRREHLETCKCEETSDRQWFIFNAISIKDQACETVDFIKHKLGGGEVVLDPTMRDTKGAVPELLKCLDEHETSPAKKMVTTASSFWDDAESAKDIEEERALILSLAKCIHDNNGLTSQMLADAQIALAQVPDEVSEILRLHFPALDIEKKSGCVLQ